MQFVGSLNCLPVDGSLPILDRCPVESMMIRSMNPLPRRKRLKLRSSIDRTGGL